jgi:CheY-like chemotaxis protein
MPRILLVDDEALIAAMLHEWVVELGFDVAGPTACVESALALIVKEAKTLSGAILDVTLGQGDSYPIADELHRLGIPFAFARSWRPCVGPALSRCDDAAEAVRIRRFECDARAHAATGLAALVGLDLAPLRSRSEGQLSEMSR